MLWSSRETTLTFFQIEFAQGGRQIVLACVTTGLTSGFGRFVAIGAGRARFVRPGCVLAFRSVIGTITSAVLRGRGT